MKILNFGSLNIDYVYKVEHFVRPGETILSQDYSIYCGGKGLNQSIALAKAGANVWHAGKIGSEGTMLIEKLNEFNVDTSLVIISEVPTGHAIIQVDLSGQNCIIIYGGANQQITCENIDSILRGFAKGDMLLIQNETCNISYIIKKSHEIGMKIAMNPAPMNEAVKTYPLELVDVLIVNEIEGYELTGKTEPKEIGKELLNKNLNGSYVLTLGEKGVQYFDKNNHITYGIYHTNTVDTTAAGDTFTGYFLTGILEGKKVEESLKMASKASAICVSRPGAADSIPLRREVEDSKLEIK